MDRIWEKTGTTIRSCVELISHSHVFKGNHTVEGMSVRLNTFQYVPFGGDPERRVDVFTGLYYGKGASGGIILEENVDRQE